uniref:Putative secreted protein n=1 Tax=Anopheles darlingi TaxID=43151 RepID=A0A2M4DA93_ANODA
MPMLVVALLWLGAVGTPLPVALRLLLDDPRMLMMPLSPPLPCASLVTVPSPAGIHRGTCRCRVMYASW